MFSLRQYYFFALWLPIIVPAIFYIIPIIIPDISYIENWKMIENDVSSLPPFILYSFLSAFCGGVQYVMFAFWASFHYRNATARELSKFSLKAPFLFTPICWMGVFIFSINYIFFIKDRNTFDIFFDSSQFALLISLFSIPIGYFYVALAHGLGFILNKLGVIKE